MFWCPQQISRNLDLTERNERIVSAPALRTHRLCGLQLLELSSWYKADGYFKRESCSRNSISRKRKHIWTFVGGKERDDGIDWKVHSRQEALWEIREKEKKRNNKTQHTSPLCPGEDGRIPSWSSQRTGPYNLWPASPKTRRAAPMMNRYEKDSTGDPNKGHRQSKLSHLLGWQEQGFFSLAILQHYY